MLRTSVRSLLLSVDSDPAGEGSWEEGEGSWEEGEEVLQSSVLKITNISAQ